MKKQFKPCPFCSHPVDIDDPDTLYPNGTGWIEKGNFRVYRNLREVPKEQWCYTFHCVVSSGGCGAEVSADTQEEAIRKWERRVYA